MDASSVVEPTSAADNLVLRTNTGYAELSGSSVEFRIEDTTIWTLSPPLKAQLLDFHNEIMWVEGFYTEVRPEGHAAVATGCIALPGGGTLAFRDAWRSDGSAIFVARTVSVESGGDCRGFLSALELSSAVDADLDDAEPFIPAVMYGDNGFLPKGAIGSRELQAEGVTDFLVREDGLPVPLAASRGKDGLSIAMIHCDPKGTTNLSDSSDLIGHTMVDRVFEFASLGFRKTEGRLSMALWYPGTEGGARRVQFDWGKRRFKPHSWRRRYHPLTPGTSHTYECAIIVGRNDSFPALMRWSWRKAFDLLDPQVAEQDLNAVESAIIGHLSAMVEEQPDGAVGVPFLVDADTGYVDDGFYGLGFCGRNEDVAFHLLRIGHRDGNKLFIEQGRKILDFWTLSTGPGFTPVAYRPDKQRFGGQDWFIHQRANVPPPPEGEAASLRELAEGHLGCLRAWKLETEQGLGHPRWLAWCRGFGEWLLDQQYPSGAFPRWWRLNGDVLDPSTTGAFNAIPFLCELAECTGDEDFLAAAVKAGEFLWTDPQRRGIFLGGTIDNPDVLDKEAASLSLESFLYLYRKTKEPRWLEAAKVAADAAASWMYLWHVPMPYDADPDSLDWKPGASTVGFQCVAVGGGGGDEYLAFNAGEFERLGQLTGDAYYKKIARILLHNTKCMLAIPGRVHGLHGPGWQQEHWSMSMMRGCGAHRAWLPWVTVCHLTGMHRYAEAKPQ